MLRIYSGTNTDARKQKYQTDLSQLQLKRESAEHITFEVDNFVVSDIEQHISSVGLFDDKTIISLYGFLSHKDGREWLYQQAAALVDSPNMFLVVDDAVTKATLTKLEKTGALIHHQDFPVTKTNPFVLSDALMTRDKQKLLLTLYAESKTSDIEPLTGILMSALRQLQLANNWSVAESGLKPFSYNKAKKARWTPEQIHAAYRKLVIEYHESRRGGLPLFERVERFILSL